MALHKGIFAILTILLLSSCSHQKQDGNNKLFIEHALPFSNTLVSTVDLNILNYLYFYNGAGVALGDFNNDSLLDIYLAANQEADALLINKGDLNFTSQTLPKNSKHHFSTGVTTVDINNDGLLDVYICQASTHLNLTGHNRLYINKGIIDEEISFEEESSKYGLDLNGLFTQASFFDYDLDGDLDVFLLKHSVHPNSNYNKGTIRYSSDPENGDLLLKNDNGVFKDVSATAGILQTKISYGLGLSTSDINQDGYPDIYIGNDFYENDYLYLNQKNGTFKEVNASQNRLKHTSYFSMGNDIADLNNDGLPEIVSVDMLPEDIETLKAAGTEFGYPIYQNNLKNGYQPQYMQNTPHINRGNGQFVETAFQSGISATEWSWSPLIADFNADGLKDVFISNGIEGATNDLDFINFISNDAIQQRLGKGMLEEDLSFIKKIPQKKTPNYFFQNKGEVQFSNVTDQWLAKTPSLSNGAAYGDLDNDGDLDLVINNVNAPAQILENLKRDRDSTSYLKIRLTSPEKNNLGIGAKLIAYSKDHTQYFENTSTRGYMSSVAPEVVIGLDQAKTLDSLKIIWPSGNYETKRNVAVNQVLSLRYQDASSNYYEDYANTKESLLANVPLSIPYTHRDATSLDFNRDPLIPYASSNLGPHISAGDLNSDGLDDLVALGAKGQETTLHFQNENGDFISQDLDKEFRINEDVFSLVFDANSDQKNDLLILSGGNEFLKGKPLQPRLYIQEADGLRFRESIFQTISLNASTANAVDIDNDGDLDISICANTVPREFGKTPQQYLFENDGTGQFKDITSSYGEALQNIGNVYDVTWVDVDDNGFKDAIVAGHWMPITILLNDGESLKKQPSNLEDITGWWNTIEVADFDKDGDLDIIAGNWGENTRLTASKQFPIRLYRNDFDDNGREDPIVTYYYQGKETTIATKDELVKQLPFINKEFISYADFAKASLDEILPAKKLKNASKKEINTLSSMYFENQGNGNFEANPLPFIAQVSAVMDMQIDDFNNDGFLDVFLVGNLYEISTQLGRLDGLDGLLLLNDKDGFFTEAEQQNFNINEAARSITKLDINNKTHYIVGLNNDRPILLQKAEE